MSSPADLRAQDPAGGQRTAQGAENLPHEVGRVTRRFQSFVREHGGPGIAVFEYLGRPGFRIVVVAADGAFADAVVSNMDLAAAVCRAAGLEVSDGNRELTARITISPADRIRMAGSGR